LGASSDALGGVEVHVDFIDFAAALVPLSSTAETTRV
jgi:hypothetical protein